jgi:hypothetical protein
MQFTKPFKQAIANGKITTSLRNWKSPQAKVGGRYNITPFGAIEVSSVSVTTLNKVLDTDIIRSGFCARDALEAFLNVAPSEPIYQVDFHYLGAAAINKPTTHQLDKDALDDVIGRLARMDKNTAWTKLALTLIKSHPATRAGDLAPQCNMDMQTFKRNVRKLKTLGLTESLEIGYQLSPRGVQVYDVLGKQQ